jgi:pilus assembly protein FimV
MSRRCTRHFLWMFILLSGEVFAIGLGDIKLDSALNEPLRAEIELLSATPEDLAGLEVTLASRETFDRYGIDRPVFLQGVQFKIVDGGVDGSVVQIRSRAAISEPFVTFLIEASWSSGRLLREYTVLLDPPTYAPPAVQQAPAVEAPRRSTPSDSGRIDRQAVSTPEPSPAPVVSAPAPQPSDPDPVSSSSDSYADSANQSRSRPAVAAAASYSSYDGGDFNISEGQTLWGVAAHLRPDSRLTINQTMLAIYEANPDAFGGNINVMKAGARLRIPGVDQVFQIDRSDALSEVQRQHSAWNGGSGYTAPETSTRPSLTLVPPDEDTSGSGYDDSSTAESPSREQEIETRISDLEAADVPNQQSLISIRDNELATLRQELANIRGEVYEPPLSYSVDDPVVEDPIVEDTLNDDGQVEDPFVDDTGEIPVEDDAGSQDDAAVDATVPTNIVTTSSSQDEGIVDKILGFLSDWGIIIGALIVVASGLIWFVRRGSDDDDEDDIGRPWETLDSDDVDSGEISATATIRAPTPEDAIVVVEQDSGVHQTLDDTIEAPVADFTPDDGGSSESFGSMEDTFSSETAVNLDQSDPIAEADFHMAYGLYDQAADLINGALNSDPTDKALLSKLCEIYFVWGNRDEFVSAAGRLKDVVGENDSPDWHKIVIMGQQIAADHHLFAGAEFANATREVDLSFEADGEESSALDMDFGADGGSAADGAATQGDVDFNFDEPVAETIVDTGIDFDLDATAQSPTMEIPATDATAEMPSPGIDSPTLDQPVPAMDMGTSELPSLDFPGEQASAGAGPESDETAEINLDELDLGSGDFDETEIASLDDLDATGHNEALTDTGISEAMADLESTALIGAIDLNDIDGAGMGLAADETGQRPIIEDEEQESLSLEVDDSLLEATGLTQVLKSDLGVETATGLDADLPADAATMLAPLDDDDDFDFSKTEALPPEAFTGIVDLESTVEKPAIAGTDVDLDLDDLTAALKVSEIGDGSEFQRDDATIEQARPEIGDLDADVTTMTPDGLGGDLHEARTMTEVGTKLDLARAYVDMGDPAGARSILDEVLDEGDEGQKQQAQQLLDSLPS